MTNWGCGVRGSDWGRLRLMTTPPKTIVVVGDFTAEKHLQCRKTHAVMIIPNFFYWKHTKMHGKLGIVGRGMVTSLPENTLNEE